MKEMYRIMIIVNIAFFGTCYSAVNVARVVVGCESYLTSHLNPYMTSDLLSGDSTSYDMAQYKSFSDSNATPVPLYLFKAAQPL